MSCLSRENGLSLTILLCLKANLTAEVESARSAAPVRLYELPLTEPGRFRRREAGLGLRQRSFAQGLMNASPGALGPASRLRRRYAEAPAGALLTGLGAGELSSLRSA
jgi:hypothetical protein